MERLKVLAIAVATGRIGYVYLFGDKLKDWGISKKASKSPELAAEQVQIWINELKPDVIVTERIGDESRKGSKTRRLIAAISAIASHNYLLDVSVPRIRAFKDKYEEAKAIAATFPDILPWLPKKPRFWEAEPRNTIYFEALAFAIQVQAGPNPILATALAGSKRIRVER